MATLKKKQDSYAHVRRSDTKSQRPYIELSPITGNLTDGTNIPPPQPDPEPELPRHKQQNSIPRKQVAAPSLDASQKPQSDVATANAAANSAAGNTKQVPLRSHPVTPNKEAATNTQKSPAQAAAANAMAHHQQSGSVNNARPSTSGTEAFPGGAPNVQPPEQHARRSSFASRFFRFRSLSSLRARNASQSALPQHQNESNAAIHAQQDPSRRRKSSDLFNSMRGTKRPASPNPADTLAAGNTSGPGSHFATYSAGQPSNRPPSSFGRMMRKKSQDFFGNSSRRSGMFSRSGPAGSSRDDLAQSAMDEELAREQLRDGGDGAANIDTTQSNGRPGSRASRMAESIFGGRDTGRDAWSTMRSRSRGWSSSGRRSSSLGVRDSVVREPPPRLPELREFRELEGDDMFKGIGGGL